MAIYNNLAASNIPINKGNVSSIKKNEQAAEIAKIRPVSEKEKENEKTDFSLVLSEELQQTINNTLGYDQPSAKERGAVEAYQQVATQEKREQVLESMSFHFVV